MERIQKTLEGQLSDAVEFQYDIPETGRSGWVSHTNAPLCNALDEIIGVIATVRDITERKRTEKALMEGTTFTENALNTIGDVFFVFDLEGKFLRWNKSLSSVTGFGKEEIVSMKPTDFFRAEEVPQVLAAIEQAYREGSATIETVIATKDGRILPYELKGSILRDYEGVVIGISGIGRDITERKRMEENLQQSERMKTILNRIANAFLTVPDEEIYEEVLRVVLEVMESKYGVFGFIVDNGDLVIPTMSREVWSECQVPDKSIVFPPHTWGGSLWGRAIREKKAFYSNNPFKVPEGHIPIFNFLTAPIIFKDKTIGLLSVANKDGGYTEEDKDLHVTITKSISPILNARLQRDLMEEERTALLHWKEGVNLLQQSLLEPATQEQKFKNITDSIVRIFEADFCRIWLIRPGDLCEQGCVHAQVQEGPHVCRYRDRCLHLLASSGRYTHTDGEVHRRVPFGCYKIGRIASGEAQNFSPTTCRMTRASTTTNGQPTWGWCLLRDISSASPAGRR